MGNESQVLYLLSCLFFLECECVTILEMGNIDTIIMIIKQMKQFVYNFHYPTLIVQSSPPSENQKHWNRKNQYVYIRGILGNLKLQSGLPLPIVELKNQFIS